MPIPPRLLERAAPPPRRPGGGVLAGQAVPTRPAGPADLPSPSGPAGARETEWPRGPWARALLGGVGALALLAGVAPAIPAPPAALAREVPQPGASRTLPALPRVRAAVDAVLGGEATGGPWTSRDGNCLDLAAKWQERLAAAGLPARIAIVDGGSLGAALSVDGRAVPGKFHAFVVVEGGERPLLVDASVQQFFGGASERPDLPPVFVGTVEDAVDLFARHRRDLRLEVSGDLHEGRYDPRDLAQLVYGAGPHARLRQVL